ncbi:N-formylglutamate amidohydrolase [Autumnicola psychrophila]|uniref:N-formylglutamate amidohydrolase n=1 Tax=Autumnicola psychrophila TaxID=3075592 RepID=A0ABU3DPW9_9FLAO|nr:N-formylglutamate amidohydrolase [Zunongwangia sp. F225]MDT0685756.1 N-formylglutamate amidohydrolase [Zunongwangia sp. F225]
MKIIVTCEHAFNAVPKEYLDLFVGAEETLNTHRGYDPGAYNLFEAVSELANFGAYQKVSRLLVEVNRSEDHPQLFSEFSGSLSKEEKQEILERYYFPYRKSIATKIEDFIQKGEGVLHFSVHTFTPELNGEVRNADIGLLFDPERPAEEEFCTLFKNRLHQEAPELKIRFNYPYLGKSDGLITFFRTHFQKSYSGIELEVNQKFVNGYRLDEQLKMAIFNSLEATIQY